MYQKLSQKEFEPTIRKLIKREGDFRFWYHEGFPCVITRNDWYALAGYVGVTNKNKYYKQELYPTIQVHGGIIFSGFEIPVMDKIVRIASNHWWFGFSCDDERSKDFIPAYKYQKKEQGKLVYRDMTYLENQCNFLASKLKKFNKKKGLL